MKLLTCAAAFLLSAFMAIGAQFKISDLQETNTTGGGTVWIELDQGGVKSWKINSENLAKAIGTNGNIVIMSITTNLVNVSYVTNLTVIQTNVANYTITTNLITYQTNIANYIITTNLITYQTNIANYFITTNQITYQTNINNVTITTNLYVYETNIVNQTITTNLTVYETNIVNQTITTNLTVYQTNISNWTITTNLITYQTNYVNYSYTTNLYSTTTYNDTTYVTNIINAKTAYITNLIVAGSWNKILSVSNCWSGVVTNGVVDFSAASVIWYATNGITFTNFAGLEAGLGTKAQVLEIWVEGCSNSMPAITFPTLGGSQYSVRMFTNDYSPIFTLVTNATKVWYLFEAHGTNITLDNRVYF